MRSRAQDANPHRDGRKRSVAPLPCPPHEWGGAWRTWLLLSHEWGGVWRTWLLPSHEWGGVWRTWLLLPHEWGGLWRNLAPSFPGMVGCVGDLCTCPGAERRCRVGFAACCCVRPAT